MSAAIKKNLVLCIPRVFNYIRDIDIRDTFKSLNIGTIEKIDMIRTKDKGFNRVFIHFSKWYDTDNAITVKERILNGKDVKIIYDSPWFWKVSSSIAHKDTTAKNENEDKYNNRTNDNKHKHL